MKFVSRYWFHFVFFAAIYLLYGYALFALANFSDLHSTFHTAIRLAAAALEVIVFGWLGHLCFRRWMARRRIYWWVAGMLLAIVICLTYIAQIYSMYISNNFISVVAIQNIYYASFTQSTKSIVLVVVGFIWICLLGIYAWRGGFRHRHNSGPSIRVHDHAISITVVLVVLYIGLFTQQRRRVSLEPDFRQVPFASLATNTVLAFHGYDAGTEATIPQDKSCFRDAGAGSIPGYPFEKNIVYSGSLPYADKIRPEPENPNVIVIFTEGISARLIGAYNQQAYPGLTPNIDRLAKTATKVVDYYNHTAPTFRAVIGQTSSGYSFTGGDVWTTGQNKTKLAAVKRQTLATLFDKRGYGTYFFQPEREGGAFPTMLASLGFQRVFTFQTIAALLHGNIRIQDPYHELDDQTVFRGLTSFLKSHAQAGDSKPMFVGVYNIGTHAFIQVVKGGLRYGNGDNDLLNKLHNYDAAIGEFLDYFYRSPYAKNTILVFTSDHATYPDQTYRAVAGKSLKPYFVDKIPLLIYDPLKDLPSVLDVDGRNSLDLAPTILQLLGIKHVPNSFLGQSLFEKRAFPVGMTAIGSDFYVTTPKTVYALADVPKDLVKTAACEQTVVRAFYAAEKENHIFKTAGSGRAVGELASVHHVAMCSLDIINGQPAQSASPLKIGTNATFGGWFATSDRRPVKAFKILLQGKSDFTFAASDGTHRPDVIAVLGGNPTDNYGFAANSSFAGTHAGTYTITLVAHNGERCSTKREVRLQP